MEGNGLRGNTCTVTVTGFKTDILLYRIGTCILHEITESRFRNIETFHTVIVKDRQLDLDEPVADKNTGYGSPDTLLSETCHCTIEVSSLFQLCAAYRHIIQKLEPQTCTFMRLCSLVNHGTYQFVFGKFIRSSNCIEPVSIGVI